ncbi:MAG: hypothetical protein RIS47_64 [Bacteroidota bacterium]|jgi:glucokinase-like ROK family protein
MKADIIQEGSLAASELLGIEKKRYLLKKKIVRYLYTSGTKSNPEICKNTNMSSPTITGLLNELITQGLIEEVGAGASSGGRRPNLFGLKGDSKYVIGIEIARFDTSIAIFNINNELIAPISEFPIILTEEDTLIEKVKNALENVIEQVSIDPKKIVAIGIDMPGMIDSARGINYSHLYNETETLLLRFERALGKPCFIENDARVAAMGEYRFGLAQKRKNVMCLKVSWGVGLGMILDGKVYQGSTGFAGEFGHTQMIQEGELCTCGKRGCLETISSARALTKFAREGLGQGKVSILSDTLESIDKVTAKSVMAAAHNGDEFSIHILSKVGRELGRGLATLIHLMNPELIIVGGTLAEAAQYITAPIQASINKYCIPNISRETEIVISDLRHLAGVMGAAALVWEYVLAETY